jgi:hypothetical protein
VSRGSDARRRRRAVKRAGVAKLERVVISGPAVAKAVAEGVDLVVLVAYHVDVALKALDAGGADVLAHTVVTIGEHPDFPGDLMVEAKSSNLKAKSDVEDIAIPPADEADLDDSGDGLLAGS